MDNPEDMDWEERNELMRQIYGFEQHEDESLMESWVRLKELLKSCYKHGLDRQDHVLTFYEGLNPDGKNYLDLAGEGDFYYMSPNEVYRVMEDLVKYEEFRLSPIIYESGLYADRSEEPNENQAEFHITTSTQSSNVEFEEIVEFCLGNFDEVRHEPEAEIKIEEPKRAEKIFEHPEIETNTIESEYEDSEDEEVLKKLFEMIMENEAEEDEESFNKLFELIMENKAEEECVGDRVREALEFRLDELETVSPIDEMEKGFKCLETVFPINVIKDVTVNPVEEIVKGHFDPFVDKRVATKEDLVGVASKVEDFNPIGDVRVVEEEDLEKIDPNSSDGVNGKNFNILNSKSFVVCDFDLQDSYLVVEAYDLNAEFLEVFGNGDVGLMGVLEELDTGGVEHLYFDPFDEIRVTKEKELREIDIDPDPSDESNGKNYNNFCLIDNPRVFVCLLWFRKKTRNGYLRRKKGRFRGKLKFILIFMMILILRYTKRWVDARLKTFIILFVFAELLLLFGLFMFGIA